MFEVTHQVQFQWAVTIHNVCLENDISRRLKRSLAKSDQKSFISADISSSQPSLSIFVLTIKRVQSDEGSNILAAWAKTSLVKNTFLTEVFAILMVS